MMLLFGYNLSSLNTSVLAALPCCCVLLLRFAAALRSQQSTIDAVKALPARVGNQTWAHPTLEKGTLNE
jgi:hypothetical protein